MLGNGGAGDGAHEGRLVLSTRSAHTPFFQTVLVYSTSCFKTPAQHPDSELFNFSFWVLYLTHAGALGGDLYQMAISSRAAGTGLFYNR